MTRRRLRALLTAGTAALLITTASLPARAWIVFDPTNYAQNVLTAARELQQVNNELQMLENQATSLINQARNLANLPYSSLASLQQQISQTQQLLGQAQRIAYSVSAIDQAFSQTYPQAYSSATSSDQLLADAKTRWQNALAGFQDAMRVQAGVVTNLDNTRSQISALVSSSQVRDRRLAGGAVRQPARRLADDAALRPHRDHGVDRPRPEPRCRAQAGGRGPGAGPDQGVPQLWLRLPSRLRADVSLMRRPAPPSARDRTRRRLRAGRDRHDRRGDAIPCASIAHRPTPDPFVGRG